MKKTAFRISLFLVVYVSIEVLAFLGLIGLSKFRNITYAPISFHLSDAQKSELKRLLSTGPEYENYDPLLGWALVPNGSNQKWGYRANSQGLRANHEYSQVPRAGTTRIMAFGASFVHCNEVSNSNTWEEILQGLDPELEVLNFGVSLYGLDQSFLRYQRDGARFQSHIVLIGFTTNDFYRDVSVFHILKGGTTFPFAKPRFQIKNGQLVLLENPIKKVTDYAPLLVDNPDLIHSLGKNDIYFNSIYRESFFDFLPSVRLYKIAGSSVGKQAVDRKVLGLRLLDPRSESFQVTSRILTAFYQEVLNRDAIPVVILFPTKSDIQNYKQNGILIYKPLQDFCSDHRYRFLDLMEAFDSEITLNNLDRYFVDLHYSPAGNGIVARSILKYLNVNGIKKPTS